MRTNQEFVEAFSRFWSAPTVDGLDALLSEHIILRQPLGPTTRGLSSGKRAFSKIFAAIPDLHAVVDRWSATDDGVLIEFRLIGTVGGRSVEWPVVDRFVLKEGMAMERVSYFDPTPLLRAVATRPASWWRFVRARLGSTGAALAIVAALALVVGLAAPRSAHAAEFRYEEDGTVKVDAGETIDDTVFLGGKTAIVAGTVDGDVFAAAERVEVTGTVHGNVFSAGETVTIAGTIDGNLHAAGRHVDVDAKVGGTGFLAGQNVSLNEAGNLARGGFFAGESVQSRGQIGRDLYLAGEKVEVSGSVARSVRAYAEEFSVTSSGVVERDVNVTVPSEDAVKIDESATVKGDTVINVEVEHERRAFMDAGFYLGVLGKTLALLFFGVLLVVLFPALRPSAPESSGEVLRDMGIGLVVLLAAPVAMFLIALTLIGIPVSLVLGVAYALLLYLSTLVVAYLLAKRFAPEDGRRMLLWTGLALLVIFFIVEIPFIGGFLSFLVRIFGMGCLVLHLWGLYEASREPVARVG